MWRGHEAKGGGGGIKFFSKKYSIDVSQSMKTHPHLLVCHIYIHFTRHKTSYLYSLTDRLYFTNTRTCSKATDQGHSFYLTEDGKSVVRQQTV